MKKDFQKYIPQEFTEDEIKQKTKDYFSHLQKRRTLREFSSKPIPKQVIETIIMSASTAPSGANKQPWTFCAVANPEIKKQIRIAAEEEEYENYHGRMSKEWLEDLQQFGTDEHKAFLEIAPWLIVVFKKSYDLIDGMKSKNYYVTESVGLAAGFLLTAIHNAGLVALTHTPSPMNFLQKILDRPENEKPFLLIPVGYPAEDAEVPIISKKTTGEVITYFE